MEHDCLPETRARWMTGPKTHGTPLATTFRTEIKPARFVFPRLQIVRCGVDVKTPGPSRQSNALVSGGAGSNVGTGSGDKTSTMTYVQLKRCPFRTPDGGAGPNLSPLTAVQLRVLADPTPANPPSPPHFSTLLLLLFSRAGGCPNVLLRNSF